MLTHSALEKYLLSFENTWIDYPFGEGVAVYKVGKIAGEPSPHSDTQQKQTDAAHDVSSLGAPDMLRSGGKMFALIQEKSDPLRVSLKCDPLLSQNLREKYETVLPGYHLNKKHWNTIICSGQLDEDEIFDLVRLSYNLALEALITNR